MHIQNQFQPNHEPPDGALVLRLHGGRPDALLVRDDEEGKRWDAADDERWFEAGDYDSSDPLCWDVVTETAEREGATLTLLAPVEPPLVPLVVVEDEIAALSRGSALTVAPIGSKPLPAAEQPLGAIVATGVDVAIKCQAATAYPWRSSSGSEFADHQIDRWMATAGAEVLRGEVAR